jgi:hypothetical protein
VAVVAAAQMLQVLLVVAGVPVDYSHQQLL